MKDVFLDHLIRLDSHPRKFARYGLVKVQVTVN